VFSDRIVEDPLHHSVLIVSFVTYDLIYNTSS